MKNFWNSFEPIRKVLVQNGISYKIDEADSIGRKYARTDESHFRIFDCSCLLSWISKAVNLIFEHLNNLVKFEVLGLIYLLAKIYFHNYSNLKIST